MQKLDMRTPDLTTENIEAIARLFPNVVTEKEGENGEIVKAVDFDLLKQMLSKDLVEDGDERYRLDWPGKKASILKANTPINKTLRPVREDSVNFDTTENLYIEGDNFEVLKVLQESYLGKVKMIYIDPPYNTGKDFVYRDNFRVGKDEYEEGLEIVDEEGGKLVRNTDTNGRFHSDWLSMMHERLLVARDLLKDDGVIFMSIDDNEVHNLRKIADEVFGEENFISSITVESNPRGRQSDAHLASVHDFILVYSKDCTQARVGGCPLNVEQLNEFNLLDMNGAKYRLLWLRQRWAASRREDRPDMFFPIFVDPSTLSVSLEPTDKAVAVFPRKSDGSDGRWMWWKQKCSRDIQFLVARLIERRWEFDIFVKDYLERGGADRTRKYKTLMDSNLYNNQAWTQLVKQLLWGDFMSFPKPIELIKDICRMGWDIDSIVLDFFSGSATTAQAVMQLNAEDGGNRRFVMVQIPEETDPSSEAYKAGYKNICEIGKERIRRAGKKILEENKDKPGIEKLDVGFRVYRLDSSNMKDVYYHPTQVTQVGLFEMESNIKEDRSNEDLLAQVMLDLGLTLDLSIESRQIGGNTVFFVAGNSLVACFDEGVDFALVDEIAKCEPLKVVFRDSSFRTDADRINFETRFKKLSPETDVRVI